MVNNMDTLDKQRELVKLIDESEGDIRKAYKHQLNNLIQIEINLERDKLRIEQMKTELAIKSNM